jgi:putative SOS response-associated peptidase YedK
MCNLYTMKLSRAEVRGLLEHYKLVGKEWSELFAQDQAGKNESGLVYPKYPAPVVIVEDGVETLEKMRWGIPGPVFPTKDGKTPRPSFITNIRNTASGHWKPWLAATSVVVGKDKNAGGRCIVPAVAFAEPDKGTSKPVINRWFGRTDGLPFFFAGVWREWTGDHGTIAKPDVARHRLYSFLTTEPNGVVQPVHEKAMPVMLLTAEDVKRWLYASAADALKLQKPAPDAAIRIVPDRKG